MKQARHREILTEQQAIEEKASKKKQGNKLLKIESIYLNIHFYF